jgi:uncharacterized protein (TIGR00297 family)
MIPTWAFVVLICAALALLTLWKKVLDLQGAVLAFLVGIVIGICGSYVWLLLLLLFLLCSFGATKFKYEYKKARNIAEGECGERGLRNVWANGCVPVCIAITARVFAIEPVLSSTMFLSAISVAASDTLASELGMLSPNTYLLTTLKKVPAGTDGAVSALGTLAAALGAVFVGLTGWVMLHVLAGLTTLYLALIPMAAGIAGCFIDSLLGATLEPRGYFTKGTVNVTAIGLGVLMGVILWTRFC